MWEFSSSRIRAEGATADSVRLSATLPGGRAARPQITGEQSIEFGAACRQQFARHHQHRRSATDC
jgi:hypothetical protein